MKSYYRIINSLDGEGDRGQEFNKKAAGALEEKRWKRYRFDVRKSTLTTTWIYRQGREERTAKQEFKMDDLQDFLDEYVRNKMDGGAHPHTSGMIRNAYLRHWNLWNMKSTVVKKYD